MSILKTGTNGDGITTSAPLVSFDYQDTAGSGWTSASGWSAPEGFVDGSGNDIGTRVVDINGDGY